jgi:hypothetical protein
MVGSGYERSRAWVEDGLETARSSIDEGREGAKDAVEAGKAAVHSARDDDELDRRLTKARTSRTKSRKVKAKATDDEE